MKNNGVTERNNEDVSEERLEKERYCDFEGQTNIIDKEEFSDFVKSGRVTLL